MPNNDRFFASLQVWIEISMLGEAIVPSDKSSGRVDVWAIFAFKPDLSIFGGTVREDDGIVVLGQ